MSIYNIINNLLEKTGFINTFRISLSGLVLVLSYYTYTLHNDIEDLKTATLSRLKKRTFSIGNI